MISSMEWAIFPDEMGIFHSEETSFLLLIHIDKTSFAERVICRSDGIFPYSEKEVSLSERKNPILPDNKKTRGHHP